MIIVENNIEFLFFEISNILKPLKIFLILFFRDKNTYFNKKIMKTDKIIMLIKDSILPKKKSPGK